MNKGIYVLITNLGVVKVKNQSKIDLMTEAENKLQNYFALDPLSFRRKL